MVKKSMPLISCRDQKSADNQRSDWEVGGFELGQLEFECNNPDYDFYDCKKIVIFVHGFAANLDDVRAAYSRMAMFYADRGIGVAGFTWPTENRVAPIAYYADYRHALRSGPAFIRFCHNLFEINKEVNVQCHSMGSVLVCEALASAAFDRYKKSNMINKIAIHGGDASRYKFRWVKSYGQQSYKLRGLRSFYSAHDLVLKIPAKLLRWVKRIGECAMPADAPSNYDSIDAELLTGDRISHSDYKKNSIIMGHTVEWIGEII